jgi:hypothetical protein
MSTSIEQIVDQCASVNGPAAADAFSKLNQRQTNEIIKYADGQGWSVDENETHDEICLSVVQKALEISQRKDFSKKVPVSGQTIRDALTAAQMCQDDLSQIIAFLDKCETDECDNNMVLFGGMINDALQTLRHVGHCTSTVCTQMNTSQDVNLNSQICHQAMQVIPAEKKKQNVLTNRFKAFQHKRIRKTRKSDLIESIWLHKPKEVHNFS